MHQGLSEDPGRYYWYEDGETLDVPGKGDDEHSLVAERKRFRCTKCGTELAIPADFEEVPCDE